MCFNGRKSLQRNGLILCIKLSFSTTWCILFVSNDNRTIEHISKRSSPLNLSWLLKYNPEKEMAHVFVGIWARNGCWLFLPRRRRLRKAAKMSDVHRHSVGCSHNFPALDLV